MTSVDSKRPIVVVLRDEHFVKLVFDYYRNIGITAVLGSAALWVWRYPGVASKGWVAAGVSGSLWLTMGCLWLLNEFHADRKLAELGLSWGWRESLAAFRWLQIGLMFYLVLRGVHGST